MRADAVFCVPAIYTAISARRTLRQVVVDGKMWLLIAAVALPLLIGRLIAAKSTGVGADHFFILSYYAALLVFAVGLPWIASAAAFSLFGLRAALHRRRWFVFYVVMVISLWWSLAYYVVQMYSARYFFPTFFSSFVLLSSRRGRCWFRWLTRPDHRVGQWAVAAVTLLSVAPWLVGIHMSSTHSGKPSVLDATSMPTSDGAFPMGSYAVFEERMIARHDEVDHNQQTLVSARTVHYQPCSDGLVEVYNTGMASFLMQAAEEQGLRSEPVEERGTPSCANRYIELRGLLRDETDANLLLSHAMTWQSAPQAPRPVLSVDLAAPANATTETVKRLITMGKGTDFAYDALPTGDVPTSYVLEPGLGALLYTDDPACLPAEGRTLAVADAKAIWSEVAAAPHRRTITVCARQTGAWLPAEMPRFLQKSRQ